MNQPPQPPFGPPQAYRSNAPPPPFAPSREALEAERLAKEARDRRLANDDLVINIYRICGLLAVGIGIFLFFISVKSGSVMAGKIIFRTFLFGGTGGGLFARGNSLAKRRAQMIMPAPMPMPIYQPPPPFQSSQPAQPMPPAPPQPGEITRWTD